MVEKIQNNSWNILYFIIYITRITLIITFLFNISSRYIFWIRFICKKLLYLNFNIYMQNPYNIFIFRKDHRLLDNNTLF
jgi:hypothetical protein